MRSPNFFKLPYNSLSHVESLALGQIGTKTIRSLEITFSATKARFLHANCFLTQRLHIDPANSIDHLPLSAAHRLTRSFWQGDPLILNILQGSECCALNRSFEADDDLISSAVSTAVAADAKVQKHVYKILSEKLLNCLLQPTLIRRCTKISLF